MTQEELDYLVEKNKLTLKEVPMSENKFTAVESLEIWLLGVISFDSEVLRKKYKEALNLAKALEKKQIIAANEDCSTNELGEFLTGEQYYNQTYGS
jgi:hypothetical protein